MKHTALKRVASFVLAVGMLVGCTSAFAATETPESSDAQSNSLSVALFNLETKNSIRVRTLALSSPQPLQHLLVMVLT